MDAYKEAVSIVKTLVKNGYTAYFAGGWVRDHVMGHDSSDIDIATSASPEEIIGLFPKTLKVGIAFGVVIVLQQKHQFEVATFRKDLEYENGRAPNSIEFCSPKEDALRRDFTINGLFYDPLKKEIYDFVGGVNDIKKGVIKTIGIPYERFFEDRLRMIRAFRFASRFNFYIDNDTQEAICQNADSLYPSVSVERVWQEFCKMSENRQFDKAIIDMHRLKLLPVIFPQLQGVHLNEIKKYVIYFEHFPQKTPTILYLAQLFPQASKQELKTLCQTMHTSKRDMNYLDTFFCAKDLVDQERKFKKPFDVTNWVRYFAKNDAILCLEIVIASFDEEERNYFLKVHKERMKTLSQHINRVVSKTPLVTGKMLANLGIRQGEAMGNLLEIAERYAITNDLHDSKQIIEYLKNTQLWQSLSS